LNLPLAVQWTALLLRAIAPDYAKRFSVATATREACMLTTLGGSPPHELQARGYHILETLQGLGMEQQLNLACRTLLAVLLMRRPSPSAPKAQRDTFKTLCGPVPDDDD
jgi:hypothetical protein